MSKNIKVGIAEFKIAKSPDTLVTLGLGSCVGVALYDPTSQIGGLIHVMLPDSTQIKKNTNIAKFADTGIVEMINQMIEAGADKNKIIAKIAGGAQMFGFKQMDESLRIGMRNIIAVHEILEKHRIPILANDTGSNYGRTIEFYLDTGKIRIRANGHGIKEI